MQIHNGSARGLTGPLETCLKGFKKIDLEGMNSIRLMKRYDTKFIFGIDKLPLVLKNLQPDYDMLEINKKQIFKYQNLYYDTDDYYFYRQHHNKKLNRCKIRCRNYMDFNQCYFEVKLKTNKKRTIKKRLRLMNKHIEPELTNELTTFAQAYFENGNAHRIEKIKPVLWTSYSRIALANIRSQERITFDLCLTFSDDSRSLLLDHLVIAELKHSRLYSKSSFFQFLKNQHIYPTHFSKYCMGIVMLGKNVKSNRFKRKMLQMYANFTPIWNKEAAGCH